MHHNRKLKIAGIITLIGVALLSVLFFTGTYPALMVGSKFISATHLNKILAVAKRLEPANSVEEAKNQLIKNYKKYDLASRLKVRVNSQTINDEYDFLTDGKQDLFKDLLNQYFNGDENKFREMVVLPQVYDNQLRIKYNSDFSKNNSAYNKAQRILSELNSGKDFDELAKVESEDKITGALGGDLGFVTKSQVLPELWDSIQNAPLNQTYKQIVVSRFGYHLLYPVETVDQEGQKLLHIKHILVQTQGYDSWLEQQTQNIRVWQILGS